MQASLTKGLRLLKSDRARLPSARAFVQALSSGARIVYHCAQELLVPALVGAGGGTILYVGKMNQNISEDQARKGIVPILNGKKDIWRKYGGDTKRKA